MWKLLTIAMIAALVALPIAFRTGTSDPSSEGSPARDLAAGEEWGKAVFAGGCFWGLQSYFREAPGVTATRVGYTGGTVEHPTHEQVCARRTGHLEAVEIAFDPAKTTYEALAKLFFTVRDPLRKDGEGPDAGEPYRSAVFYLDETQKAIAEGLLAQLGKKGHRVVTGVVKASTFWPAEAYHQDYYEKRGKAPYCHTPTGG